MAVGDLEKSLSINTTVKITGYTCTLSVPHLGVRKISKRESDLQDYSRSLELVLVDKPTYGFLLVVHCNRLFCTVYDILSLTD